jgi:hypothetical protein
MGNLGNLTPPQNYSGQSLLEAFGPDIAERQKKPMKSPLMGALEGLPSAAEVGNAPSHGTSRQRRISTTGAPPDLARGGKVSNWIDYTLDVLATSPEEINRIAARLKQLSSELLDWVAKKEGCKADEIAQQVADLVSFEFVENLFYIEESINKARRFKKCATDEFTGIIHSHIREISAEFPNAVFLLDYRDILFSHSALRVIRAGQVVQRIVDGEQKAQGVDRVLLDIFVPFIAE